MSRKQKIIISITGIVLVSLILIGLTYAYFLTVITGNTNGKSISVSTANLVLEYADVNDELITDSAVEPGKSWTKTFAATNKGNTAVTYGVALENIVNTLERKKDLFYILDCKQYSKTEFSIDKTNKTVTGTISGACNGVSDETTFPSIGTIIVQNEIADDKTQVYTLTITYKEMNIDQSVDMNKTFSAKANIVDPNVFKPYGEGTLATAIIDSATNKTNGTEFLEQPKTQVATEISAKWSTGKYGTETVTTGSLCDEYEPWLVGDSETAAKDGSSVSSYEEAVGKYVYDQCDEWTKYLESYDASSSTLKFRAEIYDYEKNMSVATDDYGTSYYYRGNVIDNYVNFAGMCWRIVRITGDGSIKLILEDQDELCSDTMDGNWDIPTTTGGTKKDGNFGYTKYAANTLTASDGTQNLSPKFLMNYLNGKSDSDKSMATAFKNFQTGPLVNYLDKLKAGDWCLNDKAYATFTNNRTPLTSQEILDMLVNNTRFYYDSTVRLNGKTPKEPTLKCNGTNMSKFADNTNMYVGTLTADEIVYAGGKVDDDNQNYYLINNNQKSNGLSFWSLSPNFFFNGNNCVTSYSVNEVGSVDGEFVDQNNWISFRPAVQLKSNIQISSGNGTKENPYEIAS